MQEEAIRVIKACVIITNVWVVCPCSILLNAEHQARKQPVQFFKVFDIFGMFEPPTSHTQSGHSNQYTTKAG